MSPPTTELLNWLYSVAAAFGDGAPEAALLSTAPAGVGRAAVGPPALDTFDPGEDTTGDRVVAPRPFVAAPAPSTPSANRATAAAHTHFILILMNSPTGSIRLPTFTYSNLRELQRGCTMTSPQDDIASIRLSELSARRAR